MLVARSWKERLFSRPWRPLQAFKEEAEPLAITLPSEAAVAPFVPYREPRYSTRHLEARRTGPVPQTRVVAPPRRRPRDEDEDTFVYGAIAASPWISGNGAPAPVESAAPVEPDRFMSGGGGTFDGGGASVHDPEPWPATSPESPPAIEAAPVPVYEPPPAPAPYEAPAPTPYEAPAPSPASDSSDTGSCSNTEP